MKKKRQTVIPEAYFNLVPICPDVLKWSTDKEGIVTFEIENKGIVKRITQVLFFKPKVSYVHLDKFGSFVWKQIDGKRTITEIGELVEAEFGEEAHPLRERLGTYFRILESYNFIWWVNTQE
ncbi:MAG: PqqD family protein [Ruminococcaceae bacterium]|nr:PqqD family protein [Oscillospiraceae bacterium]